MLQLEEPLGGRALIEEIYNPEDLPDARLYTRLAVMASGMLRAVVVEGDERPANVKRADRRGAARLIANPRIDTGPLEKCATRRCVEAIVTQPSVLVAHDTSEFDEHGRHEPHDAGPLRSSHARGYLLHSGVVIDPECEARVGLVYLRTWTRPFPQGKPRPEGHVAGAQPWKNEDDKWFWGVRQAEKALADNGFKGEVRHVADHEGSSFASLAKATHRKCNYTARTMSDRCIHERGTGGMLFSHLQAQPAMAQWTLNVQQQISTTVRGASRPRRDAKLELRYAPVTLKATCNYEGTLYKKGLRVWAVYVSEPDPPPNVVPLEWMLLTTKPVESVCEAKRAVSDYHCRWGAEDTYKVIKSGCHAELATVSSLDEFHRLMVLVWPVAMHIVRWTYASRVTPLAPAAPFLDDEAMDALKEASRYHNLKLPRRPWTIRDVILHLAQMGGYELRKDRVPGWKVIWRGWGVFNNFWDHLRFIRARAAEPRRRRPPQTTPAPGPPPWLPREVSM